MPGSDQCVRYKLYSEEATSRATINWYHHGRPSSLQGDRRVLERCSMCCDNRCCSLQDERGSTTTYSSVQMHAGGEVSLQPCSWTCPAIQPSARIKRLACRTRMLAMHK
jgi:hypothetical protein